MRISPHLRLVPIAGLLACAEPGGLLLPGNGGDAGSRDADGGELRQGDASVVVDLDAGLEPCWTLGPSIPLLAPPARGYAAAAFDDRCGRLLMFSGDAVVPSACEPSSMARLLNDLVVYDVVTQTWHEMPVVSEGPLPRSRGAAVWDAKRERLLLFGGRYRRNREPPRYLADVWAFDPRTRAWSELEIRGGDGPPPSMDMVAVMDRQTDRMIVHSGGQATTHPAPNRTTWALDLVANTWSMLRVDPTDWTPGLMYHAGAFDPVGRTLVVFGGRSDDFGFSILQDTWSLDVATEQWTQILSANVAPEARINARMLHDAERNRMIMFGGFTDQTIGASNDVWVFDLASFEWSRSSAGDVFNREPIAACEFPGDFVTADLSSPERRRGHVFVQAGAIAILHGGRTDCGFANDTWHFDLETLAWTPIHQSAQGLTCPRKGEVNCSGPLARLCD